MRTLACTVLIVPGHYEKGITVEDAGNNARITLSWDSLVRLKSDHATYYS